MTYYANDIATAPAANPLAFNELKERYPFTCTQCSNELWAASSIMMQLKINSGFAFCSCGQMNVLKIDESNTQMIATACISNLCEVQESMMSDEGTQ